MQAQARSRRDRVRYRRHAPQDLLPAGRERGLPARAFAWVGTGDPSGQSTSTVRRPSPTRWAAARRRSPGPSEGRRRGARSEAAAKLVQPGGEDHGADVDLAPAVPEAHVPRLQDEGPGPGRQPDARGPHWNVENWSHRKLVLIRPLVESDYRNEGVTPQCSSGAGLRSSLSERSRGAPCSRTFFGASSTAFPSFSPRAS